MATDATSPVSSHPLSASASDPGRSTSATGSADFLALTTPFVQPPECSSIWAVTSDTLPPWESISGTVTILFSNVADERFSSCQPAGWDAGGETSRFYFSPAVCPSGWTYYSMEELSDYGSTYSMAYCCASGMTLDLALDDIVPSITDPCYQFFEDGETTITYTDAASSTGIFTGGALIHNAWRIDWEADDRATLSPQLPTLTSRMIVPTWVPGETIPPGKYDPDSRAGTSHHDWDGIVRFVMIGIPIIGVAIIAFFSWLCIRKYKKKKQARRMAEVGNTESTDGDRK